MPRGCVTNLIATVSGFRSGKDRKSRSAGSGRVPYATSAELLLGLMDAQTCRKSPSVQLRFAGDNHPTINGREYSARQLRLAPTFKSSSEDGAIEIAF